MEYSKDRHETLARMREHVEMYERGEFPDDVPEDWKGRILETWRRLLRIQERYCADEITLDEWTQHSFAVWDEMVPREVTVKAITDEYVRRKDSE